MREDIEKAHSHLIKAFIEDGVLSRHLFKYKDSNIYPVLIGGVNVLRCAKLSKSALDLIGTVYKNDIDIKFVVSKTIKNNNDPLVSKAHDQRMQFLYALMSDVKMIEKVERIASKFPNLKIELRLQRMQKTSNYMLNRNLMVNINAVYMDLDGKNETSKEFIDTGLYTSYSQELFNSYKNFFKDELNRPIPYHFYKHIPFATCGWSYYDTVRMLILYGDRYKSAQSRVDKRFFFLRYIKYLAKFCVLYLQMNKVLKNDPREQELKDIYDKAQNILSEFDIKDKSVKGRLNKDAYKTLQKIADTLSKNTNMKSLETIIRKGIKADSLKEQKMK